jgi:hypothetical protein
VGRYLNQLVNALNSEMPISVFSGTTPESVWTGVAGNIVVNVGSASTNTRLWVKAGSPTVQSRTSWFAVRIG